MWFWWDLIITAKISVFKIFELLQPYFKKDTILIFESFSDKTDLINLSILADYLKDKNIKYKFVFNYKNPSYKKIKGITINCSNKKDFLRKTFFTLLRTHTLVSSVGFMSTLDNYFCDNPYINYVFTNHGVTLLKNAQFIGFSPKMFNYFLVSNYIEKNIISNECKFKEKNIIKTGLVRFDKLSKKINEQKKILLMFTWRKSLNNNNYWNSLYHNKLCDLLSDTNLNKLINESNIKFTLTIHPCMHKIKGLVNFLRDNYESENFQFIETSDISKNIGSTDLFITDYSSLFFDFAYLDIPIIFYRLDSDIQDENYLEKESINYACTKDNLLYNCCYNKQDTINLISKYIDNSFELEKEFVLKNKVFFDYVERGKCCKRFVDEIMKLRKDTYEKSN